MLISQRPTLAEEVMAENRSQFVIEPLEPGFGYTLGNSLRRTLLSSIPGAAVTSIRIDGVLHEFTTVPGVKEDVTDIILNLKGLVVSSEEDEPVTMYLRKQGPGAVTAGDIVPPAGVTVHNPEMHIATLNDKGKLEVELVVERGRGYVPAVQNKASGAEIGRIPVDSIYSPVLKVTYKVEATRVEQRTDFDKLILDVETKNSITARDALASAGKTLVELFGLARELNVEAEGIEIGPSPAEADHIASFALPIDDLDLTVRSYNCLKREGVHTVGELVARTESDLLDIRNFGQKSIDEVKIKLHQLGLSLKDSPATFDPSEVAGYDVATGTWNSDAGYDLDDRPGLRRNRTALIPSRSYLIRGSASLGVVAMPKPTKGPRLGGSSSHQKAILANLATSLFEHGRIKTTEPKARALRPYAEKLITHAKKGTLHNRREVMKKIRDKDVVHTLFAEIGPFFADRNGGYTRIIKVEARKGDNAPMAVIELVREKTVTAEANRARRAAASKKAAPAKAAPAAEEAVGRGGSGRGDRRGRQGRGRRHRGGSGPPRPRPRSPRPRPSRGRRQGRRRRCRRSLAA